MAVANRQMDPIFTDFGVTHTFETYVENHTNRVIEPIEMRVLPFFFERLSFRASKNWIDRKGGPGTCRTMNLRDGIS